MKIHGYTESGSIDATIDGQRWNVPDDPANRHRQMIAEWEGNGNTIPPYAALPDDNWSSLRSERDARLAATDWIVQRHAEELALEIATTLSPEQHTDLLAYRQALRDLPENTDDPADPVWPVNPVG